MHWVPMVTTLAAGASGTLAITKAIRLMRAQKPNHPITRSLFPNGERDQIIQAIDELKLENRERRREIHSVLQIVKRIADDLGIEV